MPQISHQTRDFIINIIGMSHVITDRRVLIGHYISAVSDRTRNPSAANKFKFPSSNIKDMEHISREQNLSKLPERRINY